MSATPILDLEQAPPRPSSGFLPRLIQIAIGFVIGGILILEDRNGLPNWHWPPFNAWLFLPVYYAAIAIHEIGHFIAGALAGFDAGGISIGAFDFAKSGKRWTARFDRRRWLGGFFKPLIGTAGLTPSRCAWMVAGGPLASIALTLLCASSLIRYGGGAWEWIGTLFWASSFTLAISAIPFSEKLNKTDGALIWQLFRRPGRTRSWTALLAIQTEDANGLRPREWDGKLFEDLSLVGIPTWEYTYGQLLAYYRRLDEGADAAALDHLELSLARSGRTDKALRHILFLEAACASATIRKHAAQARIWRERARKVRKPESLDVVDAGIAMCEGRYEEAVRHWEAAKARTVRLHLDSGLIRFATDKWAEWESTCRAAR